MKGYKTLAFAVVTAIVPLLGMAEILVLIPPEYVPHYMLAVAIATAGLRFVTTTPIGKDDAG